MIVSNYDPDRHFTDVIQATLRAKFPWLTYSIFKERGGRMVRWENNSGVHEHLVPYLDKEEMFELIDAIERTEK